MVKLNAGRKRAPPRIALRSVRISARSNGIRATAYTRAAKASLEIKKNIESREIFAASSQLVHAMR